MIGNLVPEDAHHPLATLIRLQGIARHLAKLSFAELGL